MANKRQMDPLCEYLALENGALTRKMQKMSEEYEQELKFQVALNLQTDGLVQEQMGQIEELEGRIDQYEETCAISRQRLMEQHFRLVKYKSQYQKDSMEILKLTRATGHLREVIKVLKEQLYAGTTEEEKKEE